MPRKFVYGPGLPGYGTKGVDGSTGLLGLATYFSAYDGNADSVTIKSKIIANKELFSTDDLLPGYPERVYQTGDIFIDKNARVFQIDFNESNLYLDTGIFLNTSGFFTELGTQTNYPQFTRYSNSYITEKFLIDVVYSDNVGNYTSYPTSIYDNTPNYFAQVKYVDQALVTNFNGWYPFQVWTTGIVGDEDSIALAREENSNAWHLGNKDGGVLRDVSLYLDFADISIPGNLQIDGSLYLPNLPVRSSESEALWWSSSEGKIVKGAPAVGFTWVNGGLDRIGIYDSGTTIKGDNNFKYDAPELELAASGSILTFEAGTGVGNRIQFKAYGGGNHNIVSWGGVLIPAGTDAAGIGIYTGSGGDGSGNPGGDAGTISLGSGDGGDGPSGYDGGRGGDIDIIGGKGGQAIPANLPGWGGEITIRAGAGGNRTGAPARNGSNVLIVAGDGGDGAPDGNGGGIFLDAGDGWIEGDIFVGQTRGENMYVHTALLLKTGSASAPSWSFSANTDTGMYYSTSGSDEHIKVTMDSATRFAFVNNNSTAQGDFYATGNIIAYGTIPSDVRLKKDIKLLENSLEKVKKLSPVSYVRKTTGDTHLGLIAQEIENIIPEVVNESMILGEDESIKYKSINYDELVPVLIGAIQEQQKKIEALEEKINQITK